VLENDKKLVTEDLYLNFNGKLMLAALGAWIVGKVVNTKLRGNRDEVTAVANALSASKRFQDELRKPGASVESVAEKLRIKQMSASEFERVLGVRWPL
jgi:hypothetical protein